MNLLQTYNVLPSPIRPQNLSDTAQWLSGEGCGSWFYIERSNSERDSFDKNGDYYKISRYSPEGNLECSGLFKQVTGELIDLEDTYQFTYLSHCAKVNIIQKEINLRFEFVSRC